MYSKHSRTTQRNNTMSTFVSTHDVKECPICYEEIGNKNTCTTECGHTFCFKCMAASIQRNVNCPCCRFELIERVDEESDEISDDEEEDDEDREDDDEEEEEIEATVEYLATIFEKKDIPCTMLYLCSVDDFRNKKTKTPTNITKRCPKILIICSLNATRMQFASLKNAKRWQKKMFIRLSCARKL